MGSFAFFWIVLLLVAGESVSSDDEDEEFTVTDRTITLCPNKKIGSLPRCLSQRSDVRVSLWLLSYTGLERNVWCEDDKDECRGVPRSITLEGVSTPKKGKYNCLVWKNRKGKHKQGFTLIALRDPNGSPVPPSTPDPYSDDMVRIVVPVVLIILVVLGIGAFCLIKRKRSQAQDVNAIIANPMDGKGDDPEVNYTTVNLNKLPSSDRQPVPVTEQTLYSQVKVN
ncbi:UNVERIFIED_CONTAM: hypothetical protein FKN15_016999 [Acipenser sinensis]